MRTSTPPWSRVLPALLALACLAGCASPFGRIGGGASSPGPGASCAESEELVPTIPPGSSPTVAAASARSGQEASSQPVQTDPARIAPVTTWNRGSGANVNAGTAMENRSQAGAPAVNQGLVFPASAMANADSPQRAAVNSLQDALRQLMDAYKAATDPSVRAQLWAAVDATMQRLEVATAGMGAQGSTTYNLQGARIVQVVANGSKSGDAPGDAIDPQNAKVISEATAGMIGGVAGAGQAPPPASGLAPLAPDGLPAEPPAPTPEAPATEPGR